MISVLDCNFNSISGGDNFTSHSCFPLGTHSICVANCPDGKTFDVTNSNHPLFKFMWICNGGDFGVDRMPDCVGKHVVVLVRKCLGGNVCSDFQDYITVSECNVRTRNRNLLQNPKVKLEFAMNGFLFMGARLYNLLLDSIRKYSDSMRPKRKFTF